MDCEPAELQLPENLPPTKSFNFRRANGIKAHDGFQVIRPLHTHLSLLNYNPYHYANGNDAACD